MSLDDRDWYRDLMRERQGLKPKWSNWRNKYSPFISSTNNLTFAKKTESWHWSLQLIIWVFWVVCSFILFKVFRN